ncbi:MAG: M1 family metallopeptidase [Candidatus Aenigmarchaeota archaeon]|nr:M1 family metallopeptidase [Candidatus Aenigmarchaeota archaeon]
MEDRLPSSVRPKHYDIFFEPDLEAFSFKGREKIEIDVTNPISQIALNSAELDIISASVVSGNKELKAVVRMNEKSERVVFELPERVSGSVLLKIEFSGILNDKLIGFYRSKYSHNGKEKYLATTQFEAPHARRAFPCFDEPAMKATFGISMKIEKSLQAISNMPAAEEKTDGSKKTVRFYTTPKMPTYILYLGVGEFEFIEDNYRDVKIRVASVPGKGEQGRFAIGMAKMFLAYFEKFSGINYPLPKLDLIAIPDFAYGAMENWGAITFREIYMHFDLKKTSTQVKKRIAEIIAHELWHQWSGNLVTMDWWNDLWLNESFATYMAYKAVDDSFPEWNVWEDFVNDDTGGAFRADSLRTTHPIEVHVSNPNEIEEIFDKISYGKGGSVLRMIESYLGAETFRKGVSMYLSAHKYGNARAEDLWDNLAKASSVPIREVMKSWVNQEGYPIVHAEFKGALEMSQKRFVFGQDKKGSWIIPIVISTPDGERRELLDSGKKTINIGGDWAKLNSGQVGFYRVSYSKTNLEKLKALVKEKKLPVIDRWGIQNDSFNAALIGEGKLADYFGILKCHEGEDSYFVLDSIYSNLKHIEFIFHGSDGWDAAWKKFKDCMAVPFRRGFSRLGWDPRKNESQQDALLRPLCISYLAFSEDHMVIDEARRLFYKDFDSIPADLRGVVFSIVASSGSAKDFDEIVKKYREATNPEDKTKLLSSLGRFRDKGLLEKSLEFSFSSDVRTQDLRVAFPSIASNPVSRGTLLPWTVKNWARIEKHKDSAPIFMGILESLITSQIGKGAERELMKFVAEKKIDYEKTKDNSFEVLRRNTHSLETNRKELLDYFS